MAAAGDGQELEERVGAKGIVLVHREWNQRIVFRLNDEGRHADAGEEVFGRLRSIVIGRIAETKERTCKAIVKIPDAVDFVNASYRVEPGGDLVLADDARFQTREKAMCVEVIGGTVERSNAGGEINGR